MNINYFLNAELLSNNFGNCIDTIQFGADVDIYCSVHDIIMYIVTREMALYWFKVIYIIYMAFQHQYHIILLVNNFLLENNFKIEMKLSFFLKNDIQIEKSRSHHDMLRSSDAVYLDFIAQNHAITSHVILHMELNCFKFGDRLSV